MPKGVRATPGDEAQRQVVVDTIKNWVFTIRGLRISLALGEEDGIVGVIIPELKRRMYEDILSILAMLKEREVVN